MKYSALSAPELFSVCAKGGDAASWQEFMRRFNPVIARSVLRVAMRQGTSDKALIDDLIQETYLKICADERKLLRSFAPRHEDSAFGFLKVVSTTVALDYFKSRSAEKRAPESNAAELEESVTPMSNPFSQHALSASERAVLIGQIDRTLAVVSPAAELDRNRRVFWLYYRVGMTASAIASIPAVELTTKGVESLLFRVTREVRETLCKNSAQDTSAKKGFQQAESF